MIENTAQEAKEETIPLEIEGEENTKFGDDELDRHTKNVTKRINKLNAKARQAEERVAQYERALQEKENELQQYRTYTQQQAKTVLDKEEEALTSKSAQVDDIYRKAVQANDPDLMSKANDLKNDIAIQKEKLRVAKAKQPQEENYQPYQQPQAQPQAQPQQAAVPEPTPQAKKWHEKNSWYGDKDNEDHLQATQYAYFTHFNLLNEGYEADSEDYYEALDSRVKKVYPNLSKVVEEEPAETTGSTPTVQRVASTTNSGRQQTRGKMNGVKFSKSELERLRGLKPHNMSEDAWLQKVAKEKQKIAQREAR
jgi:hypothetical protein